jgi:hypothetical protein
MHCEATWYLYGVHDEETDLTLTLFSGEAGFHSSGHTDSQNNIFPLLMCRMPFHDAKVDVWCGMSN